MRLFVGKLHGVEYIWSAFDNLYNSAIKVDPLIRGVLKLKHDVIHARALVLLFFIMKKPLMTV